jgi:hypothetical protein
MKSSNQQKYTIKVIKILGKEKLANLHNLQIQSLNNQLYDLLEEHNCLVEEITQEEIIGRYELVTNHIYPNEVL